jgi:hypothetical protein
VGRSAPPLIQSLPVDAAHLTGERNLFMYIGVGSIVFILVIVVLFMMLRGRA